MGCVCDIITQWQYFLDAVSAAPLPAEAPCAGLAVEEHATPGKNMAQDSSAAAEVANNAAVRCCTCGTGSNGHAAAAEGVEDADPGHAGGGIIQTEHPDLDPGAAPPALRQHQLTASVGAYRAAAIAHGIPFR